MPYHILLIPLPYIAQDDHYGPAYFEKPVTKYQIWQAGMTRFKDKRRIQLLFDQ
jgi:hypothetical protein